MRPARAAAFAFVLTLAAARPAAAISTLEDTLRDLPRITRVPSTVPPNNAVRRYIQMPERGGGDPGTPDEGPGADAAPVTVPSSSAPWAVALSDGADLDAGFVCAGVLIAPNWVLTAAHCTYNVARRWPTDSDAYVFAGTDSLNKPKNRFSVLRIVPHPEYDAKSLKNDIALIEIDAKGNAAGAPIRLEGPPAAQQVGEIVTVLGWGITTQSYGRQHEENLQAIEGAVLDDAVCFSPANFSDLRDTGVFCAASLLKYHDTCFRFGGSPVVMYDDKAKLYLAGIVSWPAVCAAGSRKPDTFLDVQHYVPWIRSVIGGGKS